jgi:hypothetical protein
MASGTELAVSGGKGLRNGLFALGIRGRRGSPTLHRIAAVEESALTRTLSEGLAGPQQNAPPQLVRQRR